MRPLAAGTIEVDGQRFGPVIRARRSGRASPMSPRTDSTPASLRASASPPNVALKSYRGPDLSAGPILRLRRIRDRALRWSSATTFACPGSGRPARKLSGGNLQKVVLGREFRGEPRVLVVAAPTSGLDVGAIETVHAYLREARPAARRSC